MKIRTTPLLLSTLLLAGCWQKSLNPFYTAGDLVSDPALVASWKEEAEDANTWTFSQAEGKRFNLTVADKTNAFKFDAFLFKLDDNRYLDILTIDRGGATIPAHMLFKVAEIGPDLKLASVDIEWMAKWLVAHPGELAYTRIPDPEQRDNREKDEFVLTADTKALQKFLRAHTGEAGLFRDPQVMKKRP